MEEVGTIDLKRISMVQYDLEGKSTGGIFAELENLQGLVSFLLEEETSKDDDHISLGRTQILTWLTRRLEGLRIHLSNILKKAGVIPYHPDKRPEEREEAMGKKNPGKLIEAEENNGSGGLNKIQDDLFLLSVKMKGFGKLFFPTLPDDTREFDNEEMNGIGEMITDFSKTISRIHDEVETYRLNLARKGAGAGAES